MYMLTYVHTHTHYTYIIYTYAYTQAHTYTCTHKYIHMDMHIYTHTCAYIHTCVHVHTIYHYTEICLIHTCTCIHTGTGTDAHTYLHTYTHTQWSRINAGNMPYPKCLPDGPAPRCLQWETKGRKHMKGPQGGDADLFAFRLRETASHRFSSLCCFTTRGKRWCYTDFPNEVLIREALLFLFPCKSVGQEVVLRLLRD